MKQKAGFVFRAAFTSFFLFVPISPANTNPDSSAAVYEDFLLDEIQKRALQYFIHERDPETGLIRDWSWNQSVPKPKHVPATVAGTGFAVTAYAVGVARGWLSRAQAIDMTRNALLFLRDRAPTEHGFFYHFLTIPGGNRVNNSELSPIDTALTMAGVLFVSQYYQDSEISALAGNLLEQVDWPWMLNGGKTFALAWTPERGFFRQRWDHYDESTLLYLMALGASTHPIADSSWQAVRRTAGSYGEYRLILSPPLFTHQYPHIWLDFRNKNDGIADYFENSRQATLAQRQFAIDQSKHFSSYGPDSWGLTAAEGPSGYQAYGAPPGWAIHDGTISPTACISSMPFTPKESIACLKHLYEHHKGKLWGRYGFSDSFNLSRNWFSQKVFAINQGPMVLMIENYRTGFIWNVMNQVPEVKRAFQKAGFREGTIQLAWPEPPVLTAQKLTQPISIDADLRDWPAAFNDVPLTGLHLEYGTVSDPGDLEGHMKFAWDERSLYFYAKVNDDTFVSRHLNQVIWRDDLVELFIDPDLDGLIWESSSDFQLGFRADQDRKPAAIWSWFKSKGNPRDRGLEAQGILTENGYLIEGRIPWAFLGLTPRPGLVIGLSPAIHDLDSGRSEAKFNLFFRNSDASDRYDLARLQLRSSKQEPVT